MHRMSAVCPSWGIGIVEIFGSLTPGSLQYRSVQGLCRGSLAEASNFKIMFFAPLVYRNNRFHFTYIRVTANTTPNPGMELFVRF